MIDQCVDIAWKFNALADAARTLTPYAVVARYPPVVAEPSEEEAREALRLAQEVVSFVLERLPAEAKPGQPAGCAAPRPASNAPPRPSAVAKPVTTQPT